MPAPANPKIYHIVHINRLASILRDGGLLSDAEVIVQQKPGTMIGMTSIKQRRLTQNELESRPGLYVGQCVPFYFCPRSVMLFLIYMANHPELTYKGGQDPIIHLESDLHQAIAWAKENQHRWAFTLSNAGSFYFEDRCDVAQLDEVDWAAIAATRWAGIPLGKWIYGIFLMCSSEKGVSANQLKQELGINYRSAWFICHRIPGSMTKQPLAGMLGQNGGIVELDETHVCGKKRNNLHMKPKGSKTGKKIAVMTPIERKRQVKTVKVPNVKKGTLQSLANNPL